MSKENYMISLVQQTTVVIKLAQVRACVLIQASRLLQFCSKAFQVENCTREESLHSNLLNAGTNGALWASCFVDNLTYSVSFCHSVPN